MVFRYFLAYLGDELNRASVGTGTSAESESFAFQFCKNHKTEGHRTIIMMSMTMSTRMRMMTFLMVCCIVGPSGAPNSRISVTS